MRNRISFIIALFLVCFTVNSTIAQTYERLNNRYKPTQYIHNENAEIGCGEIQPGWWSAQWEIIPTSDGYVRIKGRYKANQYLHIQNAKIECGAAPSNWWSAQWKIIPVTGGFIRIQNRHKPNQYLHNESGKIACGTIQPGWWSAQWKRETLGQTPAKSQSVSIPQEPVRKVATYIPETSWIAKNLGRLGNKKLNRLVLPGAHDSGTYDLSGTWSNGVNDLYAPDTDNRKRGVSFLGDIAYNGWAEAQEKNIYEQLNDGIRYIDIRICVDKSNRIKTCHGLYGSRIEEVLDHAKKFSDENPREPFILDFNHFCDWAEKTRNKAENNANYQGTRREVLNTLAEMIRTRFADKLAPNTLSSESTLNQLMATGRPVIVTWSKEKTTSFAQKYFWPSSYASTYDNNIREFRQDKIQHLNNRLRALANESKFVLNAIQITPSESLYKQGAEPTGTYPGNLKNLAAKTNPVILSYLANEWKGLRHNIISADYYNRSSLITLCKKLNGLSVNNPGDRGYSMADRKASDWGKWKLGGVVNLFTETPDHEYTVEIDCNHADLDDTSTGAKITVAFYKGNTRVHGIYKNGVTDCALIDATFRFETTQELTHIVVSTDGGDAFYIDELRVLRGGELLVHHGRDNGSGWCLSTDANDYKGGWEGKVAGNTCKSSHTFSFDARRPSNYEVEIDCNHSDLDDTDTGARISVDFYAGSKMVASKYQDGVSNCSTSDADWDIDTGEKITHVIVRTNGGDAYYIDEIRLYKDGKTIQHHGRDNGSGWCLSTDVGDYKGGWEGKVAGNTCKSSFRFNY